MTKTAGASSAADASVTKVSQLGITSELVARDTSGSLQLKLDIHEKLQHEGITPEEIECLQVQCAMLGHHYPTEHVQFAYTDGSVENVIRKASKCYFCGVESE